MVTTIKWVHQIISDLLQQAGKDNPRRQAAQLVSDLLRQPLADLYRYPDAPLEQSQAERLIDAARKHAQGVPLVYLTERTVFFGRPFIVRPGVLIPRSDSEVLVEAALSCLLENRFSVGGDTGRCRSVSDSEKNTLAGLSTGGSDSTHTGITAGDYIQCEARSECGKTGRQIRVLDLCTGSGCIGISIAAELRQKDFDVTLTLTDIDEAALACAAENIKLHQLSQQASLLKTDLLPEKKQPYDLILANPPYIPSADISHLSLEVQLYEPRHALDGGDDGLLFYRRLIEQIPSYLDRGGLVLLEHGWNQAKDVVCMLQRQGCFTHIHVCTDYGGHERVSGGLLKDLA